MTDKDDLAGLRDLHNTIDDATEVPAAFLSAAASAELSSEALVDAAGVAEIACVATTETWVNIIREHPTVVNQSAIYRVDVWHIYMAILLTSGIVVSLYFMYDVRRRNANSNEESFNFVVKLSPKTRV
jgi:hypothetical protein